MNETRLPNGVRIVTEHVPEARCAAVALVLRRGSRDETATQGGLSHLLEHLLFRGTSPRPGAPRGRSRRELAIEIDRLGGGLDAWTEREATGFEIEVLPEALPRGLDLLADLVARPSLEPSELEREREVVREEIRAAEDDPSDELEELWAAWSFPDHPLGRPILGTERDLDRRRAPELRRFHAQRHRGGVLLACATGPLDHEEVVAAWSAGLSQLPAGAPEPGPAAPTRRRGVLVRRREHLEQAQLILSMPGLSASDPRRTALDLLVVLLGEGNSSRLWQRVREDEGLAYDVALSSVAYRDSGRLLLEAAAAPERLRPILRIVEEETAALRREGPEEDELERARENLRTGLVLAWEGAGAHLDALTDSLLAHGRPVPLEERLARLEAVSLEEVHGLARELLGDRRRGLVVLGPSEVPRFTEADLGPAT